MEILSETATVVTTSAEVTMNGKTVALLLVMTMILTACMDFGPLGL
jgi:hypothetical protein